MAKVECKCGNYIYIGQIPNPHDYLSISEVEYENFS